MRTRFTLSHSRGTEIQHEALARAVAGPSLSNYPAIFEGFFCQEFRRRPALVRTHLVIRLCKPRPSYAQVGQSDGHIKEEGLQSSINLVAGGRIELPT